MGFIKAKGIKGKLYIPDKTNSPKKHNCEDCYNCLMCADEKCEICLKKKKCSLKMKELPSILWQPTNEIISESNIGQLMAELKTDSYPQLHKWSIDNKELFWKTTIKKLNIIFKKNPEKILDIEKGVENPVWLQGAQFNIVDSCFKVQNNKIAIISGNENSDNLTKVSFEELEFLTNRVANGLHKNGFKKDDRIAIYMPMTIECVAIYLGIIKAGYVAVSIADSFQPAEISTRINISDTKAAFTVDFSKRAGKTFSLFENLKKAGPTKAIVIKTSSNNLKLRKGDLLWEDFLSSDKSCDSITASPDDFINILFSSGTTAAPKAIPWTHTTPIKSASDGYFHQDIHGDDVVAWPTNIGWMMGPWLIFASLINNATIALFDGAPFGDPFGKFIQEAKVTMLGVVPAMVRKWKESNSMEKYDWSSIKVFSSTGECSNVEDYGYLMSLAGYNAPIIEYCGGTEIGGGHITGTVVQPASPTTFTTPALGIDFIILNEKGNPTKKGETGEIFLIPPSIGLSQTLLNKNHHDEYFKDCPKLPDKTILRRHGDEVAILQNGFFQGNGRADDTMNLAGIKISSATLERVMSKSNSVNDIAAIAITPKKGGADQLIVYAVPKKNTPKDTLKTELQKLINNNLNPLFKISDIIITNSLPRTASNKIIRRQLRKEKLSASASLRQKN